MRTRLVFVLAAAVLAVGLSGTAASAGILADKLVDGWNTLAMEEQGGRTYCVQMKTIAEVDEVAAYATAKVRVMKSKNGLCDKRVHNLNVGSDADVVLDGNEEQMDPECFAMGFAAVNVSGTQLLKAQASNVPVLDCVNPSFTVFGDTDMLVGKEKHGDLVLVEVGQDGPTLPAGP